MTAGVKDVITPGTQYGRLSIIEEVIVPNAHWRRYVRCRCICGAERVFRLSHLKSGASTSCGCLVQEQTRQRRLTHGESRGATQTKEYRCWVNMKTRCTNSHVAAYSNYGGRGIAMCDRWLNSFEDFLADVGRCPGTGYSLDRIDNARGYEPGNVRWVTAAEQSRNMRKNKLVTYEGVTQPLVVWAEKLNLPYQTLYARIVKAGWSVERAFTAPVKSRSGRPRTVGFSFQGQERPLVEWSRMLHMPYATLYARIYQFGWDVERAFSTPIGY